MTILNKVLPIFLVLLLTGYAGHSQAIMSQTGGVIYLNKNEDTSGTLPGKRGGYYDDHPFGYGVTKTYDTFMKYYVAYVTESGAYATERKVIEKPEIYKSVLDIEKFLKKEVKNGRIPQSEAADRLDKILEMAVNVRLLETQALEKALDDAKSAEDKEEIFRNVRFQMK